MKKNIRSVKQELTFFLIFFKFKSGQTLVSLLFTVSQSFSEKYLLL